MLYRDDALTKLWRKKKKDKKEKWESDRKVTEGQKHEANLLWNDFYGG